VLKAPPMALTDYEKYIRTEGLLALQKDPTELACHDEMQFQIVHQVAELWMKLIDHEIQRFARVLDDDDLAPAVGSLRRVALIQRLLIDQLDLMDTMSSKAYMTVRAALGSGSGQESPGFKTLLRLPGELMWPAFSRFLGRQGVNLREIYDEPEAKFHLYQLCEGMVDYDQLLQTWRYRHLMMVYRVIGAGTPSLKGKPSDLLAEGMKKRFFPELWHVRDELFSEWTKSMLAKGKDTGYHG
jgi:tryptophan 2,3-dioxygenase